MKLIMRLLCLLSLAQVGLAIFAVDDGRPTRMVNTPLPRTSPFYDVSRKIGFDEKVLLSKEEMWYFTLHSDESPVQYYDSGEHDFTFAPESFFWKDVSDETNQEFLLNVYESTAQLVMKYETVTGESLYYVGSAYFIAESDLATAGHNVDECVCSTFGRDLGPCDAEGLCAEPGYTRAFLQSITLSTHEFGVEKGRMHTAKVLEHEIVDPHRLGDIWRSDDVAILHTDYKSKFYVDLIDFDVEMSDLLKNKAASNSYTFVVIGYPYLQGIGDYETQFVGGVNSNVEPVDGKEYKQFWRFSGDTRKYLSVGNGTLSKYESLVYHSANTHGGNSGGPAIWISGEKRGVVGVHVGYIGAQPSNAFVTTKSPLLAKYIPTGDEDTPHDEL